MYTYSITPLSEAMFDQIVEDVKYLYENDISTVPLFKMTLVPEGNPVWDKVGKMCALYRKYKEALAPYGVKTGVLVQASIGHGYGITPNPFTKYVNLTDGKEEFVCCPEDDAFIEHFSEVMKTIAKEHPAALMLDDDFRLLVRPGRGCACERHMKLFNESTGLNFTREQLYEYVTTHPYADPITLKYLETQTNSLVKAARAFRAAIDSVDPTIQGINCTSGPETDSVIYTAPEFAGKGNPTIVRVPNGSYAPRYTREISTCMCNAARAAIKLKRHGIDIILAETDTIPFNRYGKGSRFLHSQYSCSMLEGLMGAKHWITRFVAGEKNSGKAYREVLSKHAKFYETLTNYCQKIKWVGINSIFVEKMYTDYSQEPYNFEGNDWVTRVFERMGIPFYYYDENDNTAFLDGSLVKEMTDEQIKNLFNGSVFLASDAAKDIIDRGFGDYLGVDITDWDLGMVSAESFDGTAARTCTKQKNFKRIIPKNDKVEVISYNYRNNDGKADLLAPAVTVYDRDGKLSVVYCGTPLADFNYMEGFAFLNETRKRQFISLLKRANTLPVYYEGDNEILFRAGYGEDGRLLTFTLGIGTDPEEELTLYLEKAPKGAKMLNPDGSETDVAYEALGDNLYAFKTRVEPMYPVVIFVEQ